MSEYAALSPGGTQAGSIAWLYWVFLWVSVIVWAGVIGALFVGAFRSKAIAESKLTRSVVWATAVTTVVLFGLLVATILVGGPVAASPGPNPLSITVIGHQWWWEVQ